MSRESDNDLFVRAVQQWLGVKDDGWAGVLTLATFLDRTGQAQTAPALASPEDFFMEVRLDFGPLSQSQVDGFNAILAATKGWPVSWVAYALATAWHETARTMEPVREAFNLSEAWRKKNLRYWPHYGRGYVQTTWLTNYQWLDKAAADAGLTKPGEILADLDLAMRPDIAALALRKGMEQGVFTGKKLSDYLPGDYVGARRIINGQDKAQAVANYAVAFEKALTA